jgi:hypothetical protein
LFAELFDSLAGTGSPVFALGYSGQVIPDQCVDRGVLVNSLPADSSEHLLVEGESDVLHVHSIRVTVWNVKVRVATLLVVFPLFVPGHLDGFELGFVGGFGVVVELIEFGDEPMEAGEADGERISVRELLVEFDPDVFGHGPFKFGHGGFPPLTG